MSTSLFSPSWYRVSALRPRLRSHAQIHRHFYRDQLWYVVQNHSTGRFHRFTPQAWLIIGMMDGKLTLEQIWQIAAQRLGDDIPTQEEVIQLVAQLHRADILQSERSPATEELHERDVKETRKKRLQNLRSPLAIRIPLLDPEKFIALFASLISPLFSVFGMLIWLLVVGWAGFMAASHWGELTDNISDRVLAFDNLLILFAVFPFVKAMHELGHAFAVKRWGGEVHEMGIMLLVLIPVPYVDASSASAFRAKHQRAIVGAAGMLVEVFIAALAMFVWLEVEPGLIRALAFNTMLIAGVSTVLFNGNPLLRFDGYYVFSDLLEIPNLGSRSNQYIAWLIQRYPFGVRDAQSPVSAAGEAGWFLFYAIASFCYRMFVFVTIIWFVAGQYFFIGVILAIWAAFSTLIYPFYKQLVFLVSSPRLQRSRKRALILSGTFASAVIVVLTLIPVPSGALLQGVIWAPDKAMVRAGTEGIVIKLIATPGSQVSSGQPLVQCEEPGLSAQVRILEAQLMELQARYSAEVLVNRNQAQIINEDLGRVQGLLDDVLKQQQDLLVTSTGAGTFVVTDPQDMPGRFVRRGEVLGYVMDFSSITARVVVEQGDADLVRKYARQIEVRLAGSPGHVVPAIMQREVPAASNELPSFALSRAGGGPIATMPDSQNPNQTLRPVFQFDLALTGDIPIDKIGERVFVRIMRDPEPLSVQWYRIGRQLFLSKFNV